MRKALLVLAIEDEAELLFQHDKDDPEEEPIYLKRPLNEGGNYFDEVHARTKELLEELVAKLRLLEPKLQAEELFNSIKSTVISIPGVVENNQTVLQLPLWHSDKQGTVEWKGKVGFNFADQLPEIAKSIIKTPWGERLGFKSSVYVVNDATACAAAEYAARAATQAKHLSEVADFVYVKLHNGVNVGIFKWGTHDKVADGEEHTKDRTEHKPVPTIKPNHPEAGHSFPLRHWLDQAANFPGVCFYHGWCFEGMMAAHSFCFRSELDLGPPKKKESKETQSARKILSAWSKQLDVLKRQGLRGQALDNALLLSILDAKKNPDKKGTGIDLVAHYAAQLVYQLLISPLAPEHVVLGGRMAAPDVVEAVRKKVVKFANGYPRRDSLLESGIEKCVTKGLAISSNGSEDKTVGSASIEALGALSIAKSPKTAEVISISSRRVR